MAIAFFAFAAGYYFGQGSVGTAFSVSGELQTAAPEQTAESASATPFSPSPAGTPQAEGAADAAKTVTVPPASERINLNTADETQLDTLPGIGPVLARRIVEYREQNGPFQVPYEVTNVKGIGDKIFEDMEPWVTVD